MRRRTLLLTSALALLTPGLGRASETLVYTYDARGRLVEVSHSGTVNNGISTCYALDAADNRTQVADGTSCGAPAPGFSVNDVAVSEGGALSFTISKAGTASGTTTVDYATGNGTAVAGSDYSAASGTLTFLAADTAKTVSVSTIQDSIVENSETVLLNLSNATGGATISDPQGTGTINDDDTAPACSGVTFTISSNGAVTEGAGSVFTIAKNGTASGSCSINYATSNGTAVAGSDFTSTSGTLTFTSLQTSKSVTVATTNDSIAESTESFAMALSSPTNGSALGSPSSATGTINDNDAPANHAPVANDDSASVGACKSVTVNVVANDTDADGDTLTVTSVTNGSNGRATVSGTTSVKYTATTSNAFDAVTYTISDGHGGTASGTLSITIGSGICA